MKMTGLRIFCTSEHNYVTVYLKTRQKSRVQFVGKILRSDFKPDSRFCGFFPSLMIKYFTIHLQNLISNWPKLCSYSLSDTKQIIKVGFFCSLKRGKKQINQKRI